MSKKLTFKQNVLRLIKRDRRRTSHQAALALALTVLLMAFFVLTDRPAVADSRRDPGAALVVTAVGDMMLGRYVQEAAASDGYESLFRYAAPLFRESDYVTGNFEHPVVLDEGYEPAMREILINADAAAAEALKGLHFTTVNLANNHMMDYGAAGLKDTLDTFNRVGIATVGAGLDLEQARQIDYRQINGFTIATLGFTDIYPVVNTREQGRAKVAPADYAASLAGPGVLTAAPGHIVPLVRQARHNADLVIVHLHWGSEYNSRVTPAERELARNIADLGADIIIGHHPHVLKPVEIYNGSVIFYSLGNFIFDQGASRAKMTAVAQYKLLTDGGACVELVPLWIREASPRPLDPVLGWGFGLKIRSILTRELADDAGWVDDAGRIVIPLDRAPLANEE